HEYRSGERVQEELDRGIFAPRSSPDPDEEVHREKHQLPEHVKEEEIERDEGSHHPCIQQEKQGEISLVVLIDFPRADRGNEHYHGGQNDHRHRETVDTDKEIDMDAAKYLRRQIEPGCLRDEL